MSFLQLLFIRHAQSIGNQQHRMQGHAAFELSEQGKSQAHQPAARLATEAWQPSHIYSSPLLRAAQTTEILRASLSGKPPIQYADALKEADMGIFTGLTWGEAQTRYPDLCSALQSSWDWIPIPNAESIENGRDRAQHFLQALLHRHHNGDRLWLITHHWILQHLISALLGSDRTWGIPISCTALFEFWIDQERWSRGDRNQYNADLWQIRRFNDDRHLQSKS